MTLRNYIIIAALGSVLAVRAQEEPAAPVFRPPFDFPLILSGNFGELRSNHFMEEWILKPRERWENLFIALPTDM